MITLIRVLLLPAVLLPAASLTEAHAGWIRQNSGTTVRLTDVLMLDSVTAVAVGYGKTILKTTNAGDTWVRKSSVGFNLNAVAFKDPTRGIAVGDNRLALFTSDGGETWTQQPIGGLGHFLSVVFVGESDILIGNDGGRVHISRDGGSTWSDITLGSQPMYRLLAVRGVLDVVYTTFAVTQRFVYRSTDAGASWSASSLPLTFAGSAIKGDCSPGGVFYVVGYDGGELPFSRIIRRGPFDSLWTTYQFTQPGPSVVLRSVSAPSPAAAYVCGSGGLILRTTSGGADWSVMPSGLTRRLNAVDFANEETGLAVGDSGTILFTASGTTGVREGDQGHPACASLLANYPNPFNGRTTLTYAVEGPGTISRITLTVHDLLGRTVATLVDAPREPGIHVHTLEAGGWATGIYLLRLQSGATSMTRKLLLIR